MKVQFIKDLNKEEEHSFKNSSLFQIINRNWSTTDSFIEYNCEYFGINYLDYSIVVFEKEHFYVSMYCFSNDQSISFFGQPVTIFYLEDLSVKLSLAFKLFYQKLLELQKTNNLTSL